MQLFRQAAARRQLPAVAVGVHGGPFSNRRSSSTRTGTTGPSRDNCGPWTSPCPPRRPDQQASHPGAPRSSPARSVLVMTGSDRRSSNRKFSGEIPGSRLRNHGETVVPSRFVRWSTGSLRYARYSRPTSRRRAFPAAFRKALLLSPTYLYFRSVSHQTPVAPASYSAQRGASFAYPHPMPHVMLRSLVRGGLEPVVSAAAESVA